MAKNSPSKIAANNRYGDKNYDRAVFRVKKGMYEVIKQYATDNCESFNGYINRLIAEDMAKNGKPL